MNGYIAEPARLFSFAARIRTHDFKKRAIFFQRRDSLFHSRLLPVAAQIEKEQILPGPFFYRTRLNLGQINPAPSKRLQHAMQHTGLVLRSEEHTSELQSQSNIVCRLLLEKKKHNS